VTRGDLGVAGEHRAQEFVEALRDIPGEPPVATCGALLHRHVEDDRDFAIALSELGPRHRQPLALVAPFTRHQRLVR
jgi:hypothetical protein